ncbi:hypothetical protein LCGC14_2372590 [marine sediment metagenome]|uniref:HD/PDEase domain-containing protein n=1 Tax=marine sediment metagenome TaxID=412755 RepID=A0A0F9C3C9_9ZZZZ
MPKHEDAGRDVRLIMKAVEFATRAHGKQVRKYSGLPYIVHPIAVARLLSENLPYDLDMIVAALLHDTVEDTDTSLATIHMLFGWRVTLLVKALTNPPSKENRATRKAADLKRLAAAGSAPQSIKLADLVDNVVDIVQWDQKFAKVFVGEMEALVNALTKADKWMQAIARGALTTAKKELGME